MIIAPGTQDDFDVTIGRLDHVLSLLIGYAKDPHQSVANKQTLKHHAEDMVAAGQKILELVGPKVEGTPQPTQFKDEGCYWPGGF